MSDFTSALPVRNSPETGNTELKIRLVDGSGGSNEAYVDANGHVLALVSQPNAALMSATVEQSNAALLQSTVAQSNAALLLATVEQSNAALLLSTVEQSNAALLLSTVEQSNAALLNSTVIQSNAALLNSTVVQGNAALLLSTVEQSNAVLLNSTVVQGNAALLLSTVEQSNAVLLNSTVVQGNAALLLSTVEQSNAALLNATVVQSNGAVLHVGITDNNGASFTVSNPLPVVLSSVTPGTEVFDYQTTAGIAAGTGTADHVYQLLAAKTLELYGVWASGSGKIKVEVQTTTNGGTGWSTWFVGFTSASDLNLFIDLQKMGLDLGPGVGTNHRVRIHITNRDNQAQDVYSTLMGVYS